MKSVVSLADVMKVSDEESLLLTGMISYEEAADELLAMGLKLVAITLGNQGVLVARKDKKEIIEAFQVESVDTTGAGDSFWGGFLSCFLSFNQSIDQMEWGNIKKCAITGNAVAALCVQKRGGIPSVPNKETVNSYINEKFQNGL